MHREDANHTAPGQTVGIVVVRSSSRVSSGVLFSDLGGLL